MNLLEYCPVKQEDGKYYVTDYTDKGYSRWYRWRDKSYQWVSVWDKDLNLLEFTLDNDNALEIISNKKNYHYTRAIRAKARHLRMVKEFRGDLKPINPKGRKVPVAYLEKAN